MFTVTENPVLDRSEEELYSVVPGRLAKNDPPSENRLWNFSAFTTASTENFSVQVYETAPVETGCSYDTASGRSILFFVDPYGLCADSMSSWDMYQNYRNDGGDLTLQEMGLLNDVQNYSTTRDKLSKFGNQISNHAAQQAAVLNSGSHDLDLRFERSYPYEKHKFAFGDATLSGDFQGTINVREDGSFSYSGDANVQFYDKFTDPYDTFDWVKGEWNPDGTPYNINGSWSQPYSGGNP